MRKAARAGVDSSIIIPAWRLVDELRECLDSIAASVDAPSHEVIVVLNGVSLQTEKVAREHPAVTRVEQRRANIGFGAACNLAASVARGENLIFLNDDTRVDPFWLSEISRASREHAVVASLILNYDGSVQEAGSRLLSHGGTLQFGKGLSYAEAGASGLLQGRPVDYGSAAALLVKKASFDAVGGYDAHFEPAYFEDVDLQLRLRERGIETWFEPAAKVLHHSGRSTSSDHWFRQFAADRSGHRFIARWPQVLATAPSVGDSLEHLVDVPSAARRATRRTVDLEIDDSLERSLTMSREYESWLSSQLDDLSQYHSEVSTNPEAPTRRELLDQLATLRRRVDDLEARGPFGLLRMRLGVWLAHRRTRRPSTSA